MKRTVAITFLLLISVSLVAGKLEKGFAALHIYNYFKAQELFQQCREKHPAGAGYGLATIYSRNDNPFHNVNRAHQQILGARWAYATTSAKEKARLLKLGVNDSTIIALERRIDSLAYNETEKRGTLADYILYIEEYCGSAFTNSAVLHRNELAYQQALNSNTWEAFRDFIASYPDAAQIPLAKSAYERRLYETMTADSSISSYTSFISNYPESPYRGTAEDMVYRKSVVASTTQEYHSFIRTYPNNRNVPDAWKRLYALYTSDGSSFTIGQFWLQYPDFPFRETISEDLRLSMTHFYPVRENDKWGFADSTGKILIPCEYEWVATFSEGVAAAGKNGKCGYVNKNGSVAIPFQYDDGEAFHGGIAQIVVNGKTGISNKAGDFVVPAVYDEIGAFRESRARVTRNEKYGFIDMMGTVVVPCRYLAAGEFYESLAYIRDTSGYGFIDREGRVVIAPQYDWVEPFSNGVARVRKNELYGIIDRTGTVILSCEYNYIGEFSEGLALVVKDATCGYVRRNGTWAISLKHEYNRTLLGESPFINGRARVLLKDKIGMIDTSGKVIVPREYEELGAFREGFFPAKKKDKWGFIDSQMKLRVPYQYDYAWPYNNGLAKVKKDGQIGFLNLKGEEAVRIEYSEASESEFGYIKIRNENGWGLMDAKGNFLLPCIYDRIEIFSPYEVRLERNEKFAYYNLIRCDYFWKENGFTEE